jgi:hypothetical protein
MGTPMRDARAFVAAANREGSDRRMRPGQTPLSFYDPGADPVVRISAGEEIVAFGN